MNKEAIKEFFEDHKDGIITIGIALLSYKAGTRVGYNKGYSAGMTKMSGITNNAVKVSMKLCDELEGSMYE